MCRSGKVPGPTTRSFKPNTWETSFREHGEDDADSALFEAGRWFDEKLRESRDEFESTALGGLKKAEAVRAHIGLLNRDWCVVARDPRLVELTDGFVSIEETLAARFTIHEGFDVNPESLIQGAVDSLRLLISVARDSKSDGVTSIPDLLKSLVRRSLIGSTYLWLEVLWQECLWGELKLERQEQYDLISPADPRSEAVLEAARFRERTLQASFGSLGVSFWKTAPESWRAMRSGRRYVADVVRRGKAKSFVFGTTKASDSLPRVGDARILVAYEPYLFELFREPLEKFDGLTVGQLLEAWQLVHSLAGVLQNRMPADTSVMNLQKLGQFNPAFKQQELLALFRRGLGVSARTATNLQAILTFTGERSQDIWRRPFIRQDQRFYLSLPVALSANLHRVVDRWFKDGGLDLGKRGLEFEEFARHEFTSAVSNSIHLRGFAQVWPTNLIFHDEEIDLVIRVGNVVLVGEAKCSFYPVSAVERVNYASTLNHAAEQVLRKSSLLERYSEDFRSQTGWQLAIPFRILPFILTNQPVGVCQTPESIPVVDTRILERFLREGHLESSVVFDTSGKKHVGSRIHFYETPEEAETAIGDYLRCPPQIHAPLRWLGIVNEPILQLKDDGSPAFVRRFVVTPDLRSAFEEE